MLYVPSYMSVARNPRCTDDDSPKYKYSNIHKEKKISNHETSSDPSKQAKLISQHRENSSYHKNLHRVKNNNHDKSEIKLIVENLSAHNDSEDSSEKPWIHKSKMYYDKHRRDSCGVPMLNYPNDLQHMDKSLISSSHQTNHIKSPIYTDITFESSQSSDLTEMTKAQRIILKRSNSRHLLMKRPPSLRIDTKRLRRNFSTRVRRKEEDQDEMKLKRENTISFRPQLLPDEESICDASDRITLNVSGMRFETWVDILQQHPTTLLGDPVKRGKYYDEKNSEYFFDRHRPTFEVIFNYYQYGGRLKRPHNIPDEIFLDELDFYEIEPEVVSLYKKSEGYVYDQIILPDDPRKRFVWQLFEMPESSRTAYVFAIISVAFTIISTISFCLETLPEFTDTHCEKGEKPNFADKFFVMETICTFWFTVEVIARFFSCPSKKLYLMDIRNYVDFLAIFPYYITLFRVLYNFSCENAKNSASLAFLRVIRLVRVFKLTKHSAGLQVLILTFKESIEGLSLFLVALIVCIVVFSSAIYYAELGVDKSNIKSIPDAFWWAVITMCTVGYGDKHPRGPWGKFIGSICAVAGVLTLAIPVPIITENFNKFYSHKKTMRRL